MKPFVDNAEYLEAACGRIRLLIERAIAVADGKAAEAAKLAERAAAVEREIVERVHGATAAVQETTPTTAMPPPISMLANWRCVPASG